MKRIPVALFLLVVMAGLASAQCGTVATSLTSGNGQNGTMFNVVNISASTVVVTGFDQNWFTTGTSDMEIYTKSGTWSGFENSSAAWTLVGSAAAVAHPVINTYVPVPIAAAVPIGAGATQAFYITTTLVGTGNTVAYTTGTNHIGTVIGTDGVLNVLCGPGKAYPFGASFGLPTAGRLWNGRVTYSCGGTPTYQTNSAGASFDVNGNQSNGFAPAITTGCAGSPITVNIASTALGNGYEILTSLAPLVPAGGGALVTGNGQIVNVDLADPSTGFLWGLTFPPFPSPFGVSSPVAIPLGLPPAPVLTAQFVILDGSHPDGFRLAQGFELHAIAGASVNGPATDDSSLTVNLGVAPLCGVPSIPFFGVNYTQMHVISNGRVMFSGATGNTTFTPTVAQALTDQPFVGAWCDLNPAGVPAGTITITTPAPDQVQVNYNAVVYFGTATPNTFSINFNATTGAITIQNINGFGAGVANMFLGISQGNLGATDAGATPFAIGGPSVTGNGTTDMIYNFGVQGPALGGGANNITFTPSGAGYTWTGS